MNNEIAHMSTASGQDRKSNFKEGAAREAAPHIVGHCFTKPPEVQHAPTVLATF